MDYKAENELTVATKDLGLIHGRTHGFLNLLVAGTKNCLMENGSMISLGWYGSRDRKDSFGIF
ncbi:MAG: hypothetical protein LBM75_02970 [Myxococcales bacterium]|jgi:hypothetical protein|nr:hypothetical protein [Myxococcales bacterium]